MHDAIRSAQVLPPHEAQSHFVRCLAHPLDTEQSGQGHRLVQVHQGCILCDPRSIAIADPTPSLEFAELRADYRAFMEEHVLPNERAIVAEDRRKQYDTLSSRPAAPARRKQACGCRICRASTAGRRSA